MRYKINVLAPVLIFLIISFFCKGQVAVGQWRDHLPYHQGEMIVKAKDKVYLVTNVGMFSYNEKTGETQKLSKITGLSDWGVSCVNYHEDLDIVFLGYSNGNIDIITENSIYNISDIKRKSMTGDKSIYNVLFINNYAYLACGFGIIELDLIKKEIRNTWFIGQLGSRVKVNQLIFDGQYIYAATDNGVYKGDINDFLVDFANWEIISDINSGPFSWMKNASFNHITYFNGDLIVNYYNPEQSNRDTLLIYDGNNWSYFDNSFNKNSALTSRGNILVLSGIYWLKIFDKDYNNIIHFDRYNFGGTQVSMRPSHVYISKDNVLWIADKIHGMVSFSMDWRFDNYKINGPASHRIFDLQAVDDIVIGAAGGTNVSWVPLWNHATAYTFADERWESYTTSEYRDLVKIAINPNDKTHFFAGSWVSGLLEFKNNELINIYNSTNSTINNVQGYEGNYRVGGLAFDAEGNLWVTNSLTNPPISVMNTEGKWTGLNYSHQIGEINIGNIIVTKDNIKWVILPRGLGLFVFDDNGTPGDLTDDRYKKLSVRNEFGEIISNEIFSIAEDKDGYIWVGTNKGIAVYYNPENVFDDPDFHARQIKIPRRDGTDNADILLVTETVNTINVDGANKKWFGTQSAGVFYTSADGIEQIHNFNADNSPLLDNNILCATINPKSGEVFFGTSKGIISYRSTATEGADDYHEVYAFPNPVRPEYQGPITITGLVAGSYVKITDISGNLVYECISEGGQAIWYGRNLNGDRVQTGVYLVFSTNEDGSKTNVTKILFIN